MEAGWIDRGRVAPCHCEDDGYGNKECCHGSGMEGGTGSGSSSSERAGKGRTATRRMARLVPARDQMVRNIIRAVFTGVIVFFDYMLMLIVMSFNIGIILSAVGGFALGSLLFGHFGENLNGKGGLTAVAVGEAAPDPDNDLEVRFVQVQTCCSSREHV